MYGRTVVALMVVLCQDLPVRRDLVVVALQITRVFLERGCVSASVDEELPLPLRDALVAGYFGTARAAGADPAPVEEVLLLPP
jgi:hypothetical protein